ncbi:hypothetical protein SHK09_12395 [Polaribacter sp. PL03]|uniref:hypothetical protein n=1 Tax=Polaribacter sp. PL03 TaxID=3088353 RepID=UPI0029D1A78B|nr:hypothetical protein [Polaribacter sp. PL03]MDX6747596.1 hypothetical protein [Polaribacter sp. PL03]
MKINILITTWINRVLMLPFVISLLAGIVNLEFLYYGALIALAVGGFQLFSFLLTLCYFNRLASSTRKNMSIYISIVLLYFVSSYLLLEVYTLFEEKEFIKIIFWTLPVVLSLLWTYILESINNKI